MNREKYYRLRRAARVLYAQSDSDNYYPRVDDKLAALPECVKVRKQSFIAMGWKAFMTKQYGHVNIDTAVRRGWYVRLVQDRIKFNVTRAR